MARKEKRPATPGDMVRTMAVILVPLLVITFFFTRNLGEAPVTVVDYRPALAQARDQSPYPVLAPQGLPSTWRATSAIWAKVGAPFINGDPSPRNRWQLGFLDPNNMYIGLNQADLDLAPYIDQVTRDGIADGSSTVGELRWQRLTSQDERTRSLVLVQPKVTTIVVGDVPYEALEQFAATLTTG